MGRKKISSEVKETVNEVKETVNEVKETANGVKETANGVKETDISEESSNVIITESGQEIIPASKENKQLLVDVSSKDTPKMVTDGLISYEVQINRGIELMKKGIQGRLLIGQALVSIKAKEDLTELGYSNIYDFCSHKFKMGRTLADNCMFMYNDLSHDDPETNEPVLEEAYKGFNISQLSELRFVGKENLKRFTPDQTVSQMRTLKHQIKKENSKKNSTNDDSNKPPKKKTTLLKSVCELPEKGNVTAKIRDQIEETLEEIRNSKSGKEQNLKIMICICEEKE